MIGSLFLLELHIETRALPPWRPSEALQEFFFIGGEREAQSSPNSSFIVNYFQVHTIDRRALFHFCLTTFTELLLLLFCSLFLFIVITKSQIRNHMKRIRIIGKEKQQQLRRTEKGSHSKNKKEWERSFKQRQLLLFSPIQRHSRRLAAKWAGPKRKLWFSLESLKTKRKGFFGLLALFCFVLFWQP